VLLLALLVGYLILSVRWSRRHRHGEPFQSDEEDDVTRKRRAGLTRLLALGLAGLALVVGASRVMVLSVTELAEAHWHVPKVVVAATVVALGTSLPELVIGLASVLKGHLEILVGNVVGADILNVLFVVGASAVAAPLPILEHGARMPQIALALHIPTMLIVLALFRVFIAAASRSGRFSRWYGVPLVLLYLAYTVVGYVIG